jgi:hypothetical protein
VGVGLGCSAKLMVENVWHRIRLYLLGSLLLLLTVQWLRHRLQKNQSKKGQSKKLVAATLSRLEEVKRQSLQRKSSKEEGYLSISQLRDDILRNETLESKKKALWTIVTKVVEANTNVRTRQAKVRGEWSRVWEWIGSIKTEQGDDQVDGKEADVIVNKGNGRIRSAEI